MELTYIRGNRILSTVVWMEVETPKRTILIVVCLRLFNLANSKTSSYFTLQFALFCKLSTPSIVGQVMDWSPLYFLQINLSISLFKPQALFVGLISNDTAFLISPSMSSVASSEHWSTSNSMTLCVMRVAVLSRHALYVLLPQHPLHPPVIGCCHNTHTYTAPSCDWLLP